MKEIEDIKESLDERWLDIESIPSTQKVHSVKVIGQYKIGHATHSNSVSFTDHYFKLIDGEKADSPMKEDGMVVPEREKYYAVFYDDRYYIGRVLDIASDSDVKMKFLSEQLGDTFSWPRKDDISVINKRFIFYGPLTLEGMGPFNIKDIDKIKNGYKNMKKMLRQK